MMPCWRSWPTWARSWDVSLNEPVHRLRWANSEQLYRSTFDDAPIGVAHIDVTHGRFLRVNDTLCELLGYEPNELMKLTFMDITHPDDRELTRINQRRLIQEEIDDLKLEKRYLHKRGRVVWANLRVRMIQTGVERERYCLAIIEDITQRKEAQSRLEQLVHQEQAARQQAQQSQQMIRSIMERVSDAFVALDADWQYTYVNAKAGQIFQPPARRLDRKIYLGGVSRGDR